MWKFEFVKFSVENLDLEYFQVKIKVENNFRWKSGFAMSWKFRFGILSGETNNFRWKFKFGILSVQLNI